MMSQKILNYMKLIDANLFIYAIGVDHPYRQASVTTLRFVRSGELTANVSTEILQEILNLYHKRGQLTLGFELFDDLVKQFPAPYVVDLKTMMSARAILELHPEIDSRDAVHAATVLQHNLEGIISADRAFDGIEGLTRFDPKELAA